ncbi:MAG: MBL fold metallo-hydrolase [Bacteroidia bacterium]
MEVKQFYDKALAHGSYAIKSGPQIALVDPERDPQKYYDYTAEHNAKIVAIIETHPHADFVSSHLEIAKKTGATIYTSRLTQADYPHQPFDDGDEIILDRVKLKAINTPGHSPDSISILLIDEKGNEHSIFTGDTLFVGDVGRPDLRETAGALTAKREELAGQMYDTIHKKLWKLHDETLVYPAHGPGSLCGKAMGSDLYSTVGKEKKTNYALQPMPKDEFVKTLLHEQPFIPKYFGFDVSVNKTGAANLEDSISQVARPRDEVTFKEGVLIVDTRSREEFINGHYDKSINIPDALRFETWLGSIISPSEKFYLINSDEEARERMIRKAAKIGYENNVEAALIAPSNLSHSSPQINSGEFEENPDNYFILDVRNESEVKENKKFENSKNIPLHQLRERVQEIDTNKPVVVHCAGGYRSGVAASIVEMIKPGLKVYDLGEAIKSYD